MQQVLNEATDVGHELKSQRDKQAERVTELTQENIELKEAVKSLKAENRMKKDVGYVPLREHKVALKPPAATDQETAHVARIGNTIDSHDLVMLNAETERFEREKILAEISTGQRSNPVF